MEVTNYSEEELRKKLRKVTLRGSDMRPYMSSRIDIVTVNPATLAPVQRYVLKSELKKVEELRWRLIEEHKIDIFKLEGYISCYYPSYKELVQTSPDIEEDVPEKTIDVLPVVVEEYFTDFGELKMLINDGMHRAYLAYQMNTPLNVVYIRGIPKELPYYSYALPTGFNNIEILESIPEGYIKKFHVAKNHKRLYRLFNTSFNNVGDSRAYKKV